MSTKTQTSMPIVKPITIVKNGIQQAPKSTGKIIAWSFLGLGIVLLVIAVVYYVRRAIANAKASAQVDKLIAGQTNISGNPVVTPVPGVPPVQTGATGNPVINAPASLPTWLVTLLWKANDASDGTFNDSYQCEVTNNIMTLGESAVKQLKTVYKEWYGRDLSADMGKWKWCGGGALDIFTGCPYTCEQAISKLNKL